MNVFVFACEVVLRVGCKILVGRCRFSVLLRSRFAGVEKMVGCRGGSRYVEGCWRFPYLKIKKRFLGFLLSWFRMFCGVQHFKDLSRFNHRKIPSLLEKRSKKPIVLGPPAFEKKKTKNRVQMFDAR